MMKKALIFFALIVLTACSSFKNQSLKEAAAEAEVDYRLTETEQKIIRKNNDFGLRLFKLSTDSSHFSNVALSPMGVIYSLNMLHNGATAQTHREIYQALGYDKADRELLNPFCRRLLITQRKEQSPQAGDLPTYMQTSNLLAFMDDIAIEEGFQDTLSTYYFAQMETAKSMEELRKAADEWCVRQSGGRVTHVPLKMDEQTKACLVNLIDFKGTWSLPFDKQRTKDEPFFLTRDQAVTAAMMHSDDNNQILRGMTGKRFSALRMPYDDRFAMTVILPHKDYDLLEIIDSLDCQTLDFINQNMRTYDEVHVDFPKFTTKNTVNLKPVLMSMGIKKAFGSEAQFSRISQTPLGIGDIVQATEVKVEEYETTAQATTATTVVALSAISKRNPSIFRFEVYRPFLYYITDYFGNICFIGSMFIPK